MSELSRSKIEVMLARTVDWDGRTMLDTEEPRVIPTCGQLRALCTALLESMDRVEELEEFARDCAKQIEVIIDGNPTDWQAWLDDANAAARKLIGGAK